MRRYDLITNYRCGSSIEEMEPADEGDWVRYEDVAAERARVEQVKREIQGFVNMCVPAMVGKGRELPELPVEGKDLRRWLEALNPS